MKNALVILAGGKGKRFGQKSPKQFLEVGNSNILNIFLTNLQKDLFNYVVVAIDKKYREKIDKEIFNGSKIKLLFSEPGTTRQKSSFNALKRLKKFNIKNVLIHDAARPFCSNILIRKILNKLNNFNNAIPYIKYNDRQISNLQKDIEAYNIQTPQGFKYKLIFNAHNKFKKYIFSDDAGLLEKLNEKIILIKGDKLNLKITYPEDIKFFQFFNKNIFKSGIGYDIHQFDKNSNKGLKLCGVKIPYSKLIGHSDADVGLHAICDSIFGALSLRDIGYHFPNTDKKWKNVSSSKFVTFCKNKLSEKKFSIINLDINIICEKPKISKYVKLMKTKISNLLSIDKNIISIKSTTNEKIGFIGNGEGIAAEAIVQISNENYI